MKRKSVRHQTSTALLRWLKPRLSSEDHRLAAQQLAAVEEAVELPFRHLLWLYRALDLVVTAVEPPGTSTPHATITVAEARAVIRTMRDDVIARGQHPGHFGQENGDGLESALMQIDQSVFGEPAYPTVEERAAHLLYLITKNQVLVDGNKRTASLLFLEHLRRNSAYLDSRGRPRFSDTALVALSLLVAESKAPQMDLVIRLVLNLLAQDRA